jgi:hypothetical protein
VLARASTLLVIAHPRASSGHCQAPLEHQSSRPFPSGGGRLGSYKGRFF